MSKLNIDQKNIKDRDSKIIDKFIAFVKDNSLIEKRDDIGRN